MNRHAALLALAAATALVVACGAERTAEPRVDRRLAHTSFLVPCSDDPSQPGCDGNGGAAGGGADTTLIPLCSAVSGAHAPSSTPVTDSSIAVQVDGPLYVRGCRGPAIWYASANGNVGGVHYRWYVSQCAGLYNYCGAAFGLAQEGDNLATFSTTLTSDVRTFWVYVEAKDLAGTYLTGVSSKMFTKAPAWGPDGGMVFNQPCFVPDYPFTYSQFGEVPFAPGTKFDWVELYNYSRNYCNGQRVWDPSTGSPTKPASPTDPPPPMTPISPIPKRCTGGEVRC